mmetsp:Transcript_4858/g.9391  ORF Transcript_4858/g.9391 Transcript_4858/m.9391 type:complete len:653 (+) Transcript_4858:68-2026(+)
MGGNTSINKYQIQEIGRFGKELTPYQTNSVRLLVTDGEGNPSRSRIRQYTRLYLSLYGRANQTENEAKVNLISLLLQQFSRPSTIGGSFSAGGDSVSVSEIKEDPVISPPLQPLPAPSRSPLTKSNTDSMLYRNTMVSVSQVTMSFLEDSVADVIANLPEQSPVIERLQRIEATLGMLNANGRKSAAIRNFSTASAKDVTEWLSGMVDVATHDKISDFGTLASKIVQAKHTADRMKKWHEKSKQSRAKLLQASKASPTDSHVPSCSASKASPTDSYVPVQPASNTNLGTDSISESTHSTSDCSLPLTMSDPVVAALLEADSSLSLDIFELDRATQGNALTCLLLHHFHQLDLFSSFDVTPTQISTYGKQLSQHYNDVPYHNRLHGADVCHATVWMCRMSALRESLSPLDLFAAVLAGAMHDVNHPGVNNDFLVKTAGELAVTYNDISVLENMHASTGFQLMKKEGANILANIPAPKRTAIRKTVISMVLATDMRHHFSCIDMLTAAKVDHDNGVPYSKEVLLHAAIHCSDISHPAKVKDQHVKWVDKIMEEFYSQGDKEREAGLPVSKIMDRTQPNLAGSQVGFVDFLVLPLFHAFAAICPELKDSIEQIESNKNYWQQQVAATQPPTSDEPLQGQLPPTEEERKESTNSDK